MRKLISIAPLLLFFVIVTKGQQPPAPPNPPSIEERMKRTNEMLQREVAPTVAQKASIEKIYTEFFTKEDKLRKENPPPAPGKKPDEKVKEKMDKLVKERDESIKKVLNEGQYKKYIAAMQKLRPPSGPPLGGPPPPRQ